MDTKMTESVIIITDRTSHILNHVGMAVYFRYRERTSVTMMVLKKTLVEIFLTLFSPDRSFERSFLNYLFGLCGIKGCTDCSAHTAAIYTGDYKPDSDLTSVDILLKNLSDACLDQLVYKNEVIDNRLFRVLIGPEETLRSIAFLSEACFKKNRRTLLTRVRIAEFKTEGLLVSFNYINVTSKDNQPGSKISYESMAQTFMKTIMNNDELVSAGLSIHLTSYFLSKKTENNISKDSTSGAANPKNGNPQNIPSFTNTFSNDIPQNTTSFDNSTSTSTSTSNFASSSTSSLSSSSWPSIDKKNVYIIRGFVLSDELLSRENQDYNKRNPEITYVPRKMIKTSHGNYPEGLFPGLAPLADTVN